MRHRCLASDATAEVVAQTIRPTGWQISPRSVERVIDDLGLPKNTAPFSPAP
jgi:hypothetical protein